MGIDALFKTGRPPVIIDGAMGTYLQSLSSQENSVNATAGYSKAPVMYNLSAPEVIIGIHSDYIRAGAEVITANTFGAYEFKCSNSGEIIKQAIKNARDAIDVCGKNGIYIALDIGPTGKLTPPLGNATFNELYNIFKETAILGEKYGADFALIETMQDIGEMRAAILAVKENTSLPVFCTVSFEKNGRTLSGADPLSVIALTEGLGVDAVGFNCGVGMDLADRLADEFLKYSSKPVIIQPNAGLPEMQNGVPVYKMDSESFSLRMYEYANKGVFFLGGCCGTTPNHINAIYNRCNSIMTVPPLDKKLTVLSSYGKGLVLSNEPVEVGRVPKNTVIDDAGDCAIDEISDGAELLSIFINENEQNADSIGIDSENYGIGLIHAISEVCPAPIVINVDGSTHLEPLLRTYNGKAAVVCNFSDEAFVEKAMFASKKYGAVLIFKPQNEPDIFINNIYLSASKHGVPEKNIYMDFLDLF